MAQHDYTIANQGAVDFRNDINSVLGAIVSQNAGDTEPQTTFANMFWYDTTSNILKMRNEDDDAWITICSLDQTNDLINYTDLIPTVDNLEDLGSSSKAWKDLYLQGNLYFDTDNSYTQKDYLWTPISTATASSSSSIDFTLPSGYDVFLVRFQGVYPITDGAGILARTSQDGGSSFDNGSGNYVYGQIVNATTFGASTVNNSTSSTSMRINSSIGNTALESCEGDCYIYSALSSSEPTKIQADTFFREAGTSNKLRQEWTMGMRANSSHVTDAIRFLMSSGNISAGKFVLYGRNLI